MGFSSFLPLASIEAVRPVFMIVMGVSLLGISLRMAGGLSGWSARFIVAGGLLLCFGYALLMPLYELGKIERYHPQAILHHPATALAWYLIRQFVMNVGWLALGVGLGIHTGLLKFPRLRKVSPTPQPSVSNHESPA